MHGGAFQGRAVDAFKLADWARIAEALKSLT
jgi:hypothetical protein